MSTRKIKVTQPRLNAELQHEEFTNDPSAVNSLGNFTPETRIVQRTLGDYTGAVSVFSAPFTLDTLRLNPDESAKVQVASARVDLRLDRGRLSNYAYYGSLREFIRSSIGQIITGFPGSLRISSFTGGQYLLNVLDYTFDPRTGISTFRIPAQSVENPFGLNYGESSRTAGGSLATVYGDYQVMRSDSPEKRFDLLGFTPSPTEDTGSLTVSVRGNPFPEAAVSGYTRSSYHILPNTATYGKFLAGLPAFGRFLLSDKGDTGYRTTLKRPQVSPDGTEFLFEQSYLWPTSDGYNPDVSGSVYESFLLDLLELGDTYDAYKSNLILRRLIPQSLLDYDLTDGFKLRKVLHLYGAQLDGTKQLIDGLATLNRTGYDPSDTLPDLLVKNLARTLGWQTQDLLGEQELMSAFFAPPGSLDMPGGAPGQLPAQVDIELWRRLLANTAEIFRSRGTRKVVEAMFEFIGVPESLFTLDEHVYVTEPLSPTEVAAANAAFADTAFSDTAFTGRTIDLPLGTSPDDFIDGDGYPRTVRQTGGYWFQMNGDTDRGQAYFAPFRNLGYRLVRTPDNRKAWADTKAWAATSGTSLGVAGQVRTDPDGHRYTATDERQVLNTKEINLELDAARAIEYRFFESVRLGGLPFSGSTGSTYTNCHLRNPQPQPLYNQPLHGAGSFASFLESATTGLIDVRTRKVLTDAHTGGYPSLQTLFAQFAAASPANARYTYAGIAAYVSRFEVHFDRLLGQLIPATAIYGGASVRIRNSAFSQQKHTYPTGIDCGSEFSRTLPVPAETQVKVLSLASSVRVPMSTGLRYASAAGTYGVTSPLANPETPVQSPGIPSGSGEVFGFDTAGLSVSGATPIRSGYTPVQYVFNRSLPADLSVRFTFTGDTRPLTGTGTLNLVRTDVLPYDAGISGFAPNPVAVSSINGGYFRSGNTSYTVGIPAPLLQPGSFYLFKTGVELYFPAGLSQPAPYPAPLSSTDLFHTATYSARHNPLADPAVERYYGSDRTATGITVSTLPAYGSGNLPFRFYDDASDVHVMVVENPPVPQNTLSLQPASYQGGRLVNVELPVILDGQVDFQLPTLPVGDTQLSLNGVTLVPGDALTGEFSVAGQQLTLHRDDVLSGDVVTATYLTTGEGITLVSDFHVVGPSIPSGVTYSASTRVYRNVSTGRDEFVLTQPAGSSEGMRLSVNGIVQLLGPDFQLHPTDTRRLAFTMSLAAGDVILVFFALGNGLSSPVTDIATTTFPASWRVALAATPAGVQPVAGGFTVQIAAEGDGFNPLIYSGTTALDPTLIDYTHPVDFLNIDFTKWVGRILNYRVVAERHFTNLTGERVTTSAAGEVVRFRIVV